MNLNNIMLSEKNPDTKKLHADVKCPEKARETESGLVAVWNWGMKDVDHKWT